MPLDYFVWAIVGKKQSFVFDTGFDAARAAKRQRTLLRPVGEGLKIIGIDPDSVEDVVISHMHFDHAGNHGLFPKARYHVQDTEMKYCTGRCMCHQALRGPFDADDVTAMVEKIFADRVVFHDGESEIAPNLTVHKVGGHSKGLQVVPVLKASPICSKASPPCGGLRRRTIMSFQAMIPWFSNGILPPIPTSAISSAWTPIPFK